MYMKPDILYLDKSPYENWKISWEYFKNVKYNIEEIENLLENNEIKSKIEKQFNNLKNEYPKYYDEVIWKADGIWIDSLTYFSVLCPEIIGKYSDHCTTIMCKKNNGKFIISHNEDDHYIEGNFCISKVRIDDNNWFVTNDMYEMPFWNGMSWNTYGIVKTINYCHDENINLDNYPRYFAQRYLTEAKSIDDLIKKCKEIKVASWFHVNAIDINNNIAVSIEIYTDGIDVKYIDDYYIHSNHFIHNEYINNQKEDIWSNSIFRFNKSKELFWENTMEWIQKVLSYRWFDNQNSILQVNENSHMTLYNFSYDIDNKDTIYLNDYIDNEKFGLKYDL